MASFFNDELQRYKIAAVNNEIIDIDKFITIDRTKISWAEDFKSYLRRGIVLSVNPARLVQSLYRPFAKHWLYIDKFFLWSRYQMPRIFPDAILRNRVIMIKGNWKNEGQIALITDCLLSDPSDGGAQCFPLYLYDVSDDSTNSESQAGLFATGNTVPGEHRRRDGITHDGLAHFQSAYPLETFTKEDIFYYVYGLLHSPDYRERYADNLGKELPRIPCVKAAVDFWSFSRAGRDLAELHLNYETVAMYPAPIEHSGSAPLTDAEYRVEKMRHGKIGKDKDRTTVQYNSRITVSGILLAAYDYVVNGKPAIDWVIERQCVKTDKDSGIVNDANDWAIETMNNPRYPLELLLRVVTVSLETMKIVNSLPALVI
jgi:predicted helicase